MGLRLRSRMHSTLTNNKAAEDDRGKSKQEAIDNQNERDKEANMTLMEDIRDGIIGIRTGLLEGLAGLKDKGLLGLGILTWSCCSTIYCNCSIFLTIDGGS